MANWEKYSEFIAASEQHQEAVELWREARDTGDKPGAEAMLDMAQQLWEKSRKAWDEFYNS